MDSADLDRTRDAWTGFAPQYRLSGREAWQREEIDWGIWRTPESELGVLGDLSALRGLDVIELGCGTAYFSAWLARLGAKPVGIDLTPTQLESARAFQREFKSDFPLIEGDAQDVPLPDASFDLAISEYGASIWCDPYLWIPEAARLLKPGGKLIFLTNAALNMICSPNTGTAQEKLLRPWFGMHVFEWSSSEPVEYHLNHGDMFKLLLQTGFSVENFIEIQAPENAKTRNEYVSAQWARKWPSEEIWVAKKR